MNSKIQQRYEELKLWDRMTPGRTPWQKLRKQAEEEILVEETTPISAENRNLSRSW